MLFRNTVVNLVSLGGSLTLGFMTTALLAAALGPAPFGLLMLVRSIVGNVGILESLFGTGITRYVAFYNAQDDLARRDMFLGTGLVVNLVQGTIISIVAIAVSFAAFDRVFSGIPAGLLVQGPTLLAIFFLVFIVQLCSLSLSRALEGLQAYPVIRGSETAVQALALAALFIVLRVYGGAPLYRIAAVYVLTETVRLGLFAFWARKYGLRVSPTLVDRDAFWALFRFGKPLAIAKAFTMIGYRGDAILLGIFTTVEAVANYQIASQVWSAAVAGLSAFTVALLPAVAHRAAGGGNFSAIFLTASRYTLAVALCLATLAIYARSFVIEHWVGPAYAGAAILILLFMIQTVIAFHQGVSGQVVLGTDRHQPVGTYEGIGAVVNLTISLLLIRKLGAPALLIGAIAKASIVMPLNTRLALRSLGIRVSSYMTQSVLPVWRFLAALLIAVAVVRVAALRLGAGLTAFGLQVAVLAAAMAALLWLMVLTAEDRRRLMRAIAL
jgi:O-antigen/teichoic acid export membrane protein